MQSLQPLFLEWYSLMHTYSTKFTSWKSKINPNIYEYSSGVCVLSKFFQQISSIKIWPDKKNVTIKNQFFRPIDHANEYLFQPVLSFNYFMLGFQIVPIYHQFWKKNKFGTEQLRTCYSLRQCFFAYCTITN